MWLVLLCAWYEKPCASGSHRISEKQEEKTKEIKAKYERQLSDLKAELKSLKTARKEHAKAMKKNVCMLLLMYIMLA